MQRQPGFYVLADQRNILSQANVEDFVEAYDQNIQEEGKKRDEKVLKTVFEKV